MRGSSALGAVVALVPLLHRIRLVLVATWHVPGPTVDAGVTSGRSVCFPAPNMGPKVRPTCFSLRTTLLFSPYRFKKR